MNLERLGIPTVTVVTEPFTVAADTVARSLGLPDIPRVVIPHDYLSEDNDTIAKKLEPLLEEIERFMLLG